MHTIVTRTQPWHQAAIALAICCWLAVAASVPAHGQGAGNAAATPLSQTELEQLVGPVALYPDDLLALVLPASAYPLQIVEASRLLERQENDSKAEPDEDWDDSVVALLNYPEVLALLNQDLDWTWRLGEAVVNQEQQVMAAVSAFREQAYTAGNLRSDERQLVQKENNVIQVSPATREVIYVPYYQPREVVVYQPRPVYHYYPYARPVYYYPYTSGLWFGSDAFWGVSTFFSLGWGTRHVHVYHHHHANHPYYGRGYRYDRYRSRHYRHYQAQGFAGRHDDTRWQRESGHRVTRHSWNGSRPETGRPPNRRDAVTLDRQGPRQTLATAPAAAGPRVGAKTGEQLANERSKPGTYRRPEPAQRAVATGTAKGAGITQAAAQSRQQPRVNTGNKDGASPSASSRQVATRRVGSISGSNTARAATPVVPRAAVAREPTAISRAPVAGPAASSSRQFMAAAQPARPATVPSRPANVGRDLTPGRSSQQQSRPARTPPSPAQGQGPGSRSRVVER